MINDAIQRLAALDPVIQSTLTDLEGVCIQIEPLPFAPLFLEIHAHRVRVKKNANHYDLAFRGPCLAFWTAKTNIKRASALGLSIEGDPHLLKTLQPLLGHTSIPWEEWLSSYLGDTSVYHLKKMSDYLHSKATTTAQTLALDLAEYLQEEHPDFAPSGKVKQFLQEVDTLRAGVERLEAKLATL